MDLDCLTLGQIKEINELTVAIRPKSNLHWEIERNYFIRTVTHHLTGKLVAVTDYELVLEEAAWIADDGRFANALATGELNEVEPFPKGKVIVGRGSLIDATRWNHPLPYEVK